MKREGSFNMDLQIVQNSIYMDSVYEHYLQL